MLVYRLYLIEKQLRKMISRNTERSVNGMNKSSLGFGGFLLGLGVGWWVFTMFDIPRNFFSWLLILAGAGIVVSALISWRLPRPEVGGLISGLMGGLILSLFITTGFSFVSDISGGVAAGTYRAQDTRSYSGMMAANSVYFEVDNFNGPIQVSTWGKNEYSLNLLIKAKGTSQQIAEKRLEDFKVDLVETIVQEQGRLVLQYDIPATAKRYYSVEVEANLPSQASIDLEMYSSNGKIELNDLKGESLNLRTSNGEIVLNNVFAEKIMGDTSNGAIRGMFDALDTTLSTSNGRIELTLPCTMTGKYELETSNGDVELTLSSKLSIG